MKMKKQLVKYFVLLVFLPMCIIAIGKVSHVGANQGIKSLYVNADLNANSPIEAYAILPHPTYLTYQQTSVPTRYGGVGLAIDTDSEILFVTFEGSGILDIVDAKTLALLGQVTAPGANNLAGIVVDQDNQKVYAIDRNTDILYNYDWDASTTTLTLDTVEHLPGIVVGSGEHWQGAHGLALDEINDLLFVGDVTTEVKYYNTADWSLAGSFTVTQKVMGLAVDAVNNFVYTGNALDWMNYGSLGLLCKYDLNTNTETTLDIRGLEGAVSTDNVVGLAVDSATGLLYITTGNQATGGSDRILVIDPDLNLLHATGDIGNPTGLVVPGKAISYDPLNLDKTDGLGEDECVKLGETITYTISYENTNPYDIEDVTITDDIPVETSFVSASDGGTFDGTTVTWFIETIYSETSGFVTVTVLVDSAIPGITIINYCSIDSEQTGPSFESKETDICPVIPVDIDIKPGSYPNSINIGSKGVVPVAILTTDDFDASTVDPTTVMFAGAAPLRWTMEDVDRDGDMDLLFHFKTQELTELNSESTEAILTGETFGGHLIEGIDTVNIVPPKKGK
jgi:uncharacterized repeat protein (TIGR01451 family)